MLQNSERQPALCYCSIQYKNHILFVCILLSQFISEVGNFHLECFLDIQNMPTLEIRMMLFEDDLWASIERNTKILLLGMLV